MSTTSWRSISTPWGQSEHVKVVAKGIWEVSTPSHGGYLLSDARLGAMPEALRYLNNFGKGNWFEEDCEWALVAAAFPGEFTDDLRKAASELLARIYGLKWDRVCAEGWESKEVAQ